MKILKQGSAVWQGSIKEGGGTVSTQSGALQEIPYGFNTRFEGKTGTNPEELLGASHTSCFAMAVSLFLTLAIVPGIETEKFKKLAELTKNSCPISKALKAPITLDAEIKI